MTHLWAVVSVLILTSQQILAQNIQDIVNCAGTAALSTIKSTGCQLKDIECICRHQSLVDSLLPIVKDECSAEEFQNIVNAAEGLCDTAGITITVSTSPLTVPTSIRPVSASIPTVPTLTPTVPTSTPTVPPISTSTRLPSTPTNDATGKPRVISTLTIFSKNATRTSSIAPFKNSTSSKPPAPTNTTGTPTLTPFKGAANKHSAPYVWAVTFLGTTFLLLF